MTARWTEDGMNMEIVAGSRADDRFIMHTYTGMRSRRV